jgi:hypothetical protein
LTERKDTATVPFQPGGAPNEITGALNANIGAYQYAPNYWLTASSGVGIDAVGEGWGSIWGGLDEFRFGSHKLPVAVTKMISAQISVCISNLTRAF